MLATEDLPPLPPNFRYDQRETMVQQVFRRGNQPLIHAKILNGIRDWTERQWRFMTWNHYRFVEAADQQIGLILNALEKSRFSDNTLILFSVDHGEANGAHQTFQKVRPVRREHPRPVHHRQLERPVAYAQECL